MKKVFTYAAIAASFLACQQRPAAPAASKGEVPTPLAGQSQGDLSQTIAKIDGAPITVGEFQQRLNQQPPYVRARYTSPERKKEFLDNLVRFEVLAKEAQTRGYDRDAEVVRTMKQVMIQKLMKDEFDSRVKLEDIKDDESKKYFDAHPDEFNRPDEVRVSDIMVKDRKKADQVAKEVAAKAKAGVVDSEAFRELVTKHTEDPTAKERGGDLRFFAANSKELPVDVVKASFALKDVGNFTQTPVKAGEAWHVLMLTGRHKGYSRTFEESKRQIQNRLYRDKRTQAMEDYVTQLKKKAKVEVQEGNLSKVVVDTSGSNGPGAPGMGPGMGMAPGMAPHGMSPGTPPQAASAPAGAPTVSH